MRDRIAEAASEYHRSMNSEIVSRLEQSLLGLPSVQENGAGPLANENESQLKTDLSSDEVQVLKAYRRLSASKRRSLRDLLS